MPYFRPGICKLQEVQPCWLRLTSRRGAIVGYVKEGDGGFKKPASHFGWEVLKGPGTCVCLLAALQEKFED